MGRWRCPACDREFARAHQSHVCVPGNSVDETFAGRPAVQRDIYNAIVEYLRKLGPVHVDAVKVGVFLKNETKLAEVRPKARALSLLVVLPYALDHHRVSRRMSISAGRVAHSVKLFKVSDVDDDVKEWLAQAYDAAS